MYILYTVIVYSLYMSIYYKYMKRIRMIYLFLISWTQNLFQKPGRPQVLISVHVPGDVPSGRSPAAYMAFIFACIVVRLGTGVAACWVEM